MHPIFHITFSMAILNAITNSEVLLTVSFYEGQMWQSQVALEWVVAHAVASGSVEMTFYILSIIHPFIWCSLIWSMSNDNTIIVRKLQVFRNFKLHSLNILTIKWGWTCRCRKVFFLFTNKWRKMLLVEGKVEWFVLLVCN